MNFATTAIELSLGLIGTLALFLGVMQIAEKAGLIHAVVHVTGPLLRPLFPGIPKGHPAMGMVTLNLTANMLGLGNAATPFGIKAMEELQKLNRSTDTATNSMVMLLAMNTAGVQLLPPVFLYAVMGLRASELYIPILIVTGLCARHRDRQREAARHAARLPRVRPRPACRRRRCDATEVAR